MKCIAVAVIGTLGFGSAALANDIEEKAHVIAVEAKDTTKKDAIFVYSKESIRTVEYWDGSEWKPVSSLGMQHGMHTYKVTEDRLPDGKTSVFVSGIMKSGDRFVDKIALAEVTDDAASEPVTLTVSAADIEPAEKVRAREEAARFAAQQRAMAEQQRMEMARRQQFDSSWAGRFIQLLNNYRAQRGLNPVQYDEGLTSIAARNNSMGGYHAYAGGTAQNWAGGSNASSPEAAFNAWLNSPDHHAIMIGGASRAGIHFVPGQHATLNMQ